MDADEAAKHKFTEASNMTFEEVFEFAFGHLMPILRHVAKQLGEDHFGEVLGKAAVECGTKNGEASARGLPCNDFAAFTTAGLSGVREPSRFWKHALTFEMIEDKGHVFEVKFTECLWAKTLRQLGAADIGYLLLCHTDYGFCKGFNPKITLTRTKTLMQGDDCCNFRWAWAE